MLSPLVEASSRVAASGARLGKVCELATLLRGLTADEVRIATRYLSGELPQGRIGIGQAALAAAAAAAPAAEATLSIADVDEALTALAALKGSGSAARRTAALTSLLARATAAEQQFLLRLLSGELRQGALEGVMLEAIAQAANLPPASVRRAAMYAGDLGAVAAAALFQGERGLGQFQLQLFAPVAPMLAQTAPDAATALEELAGEAAFEWKMDGARIQVHKDGTEVRIYTRALNEITPALPEIVEVALQLPAGKLILDGEAIALDPRGRPRPFQVTMKRFGRRLEVDAMRASLPLSAFFFDCLRLGEDSLVELGTEQRVAALAQAVSEPLRVPRLVTSSPAAAQSFYEAALAAGHEGIMAKSLTAPYATGSRGADWFKIKRAHTLDLVVLAAEWGHGRRSGLLSNLHLGARNPASGEYVMLGKTFKGLTDAMLEWQTRELLARESRRDRYTVYVRPELVVEIAFSDLQASPRYPAGLALRLARVKAYRADKSAVGADTLDTVRKIFESQQQDSSEP
ncbi:MAG: ATP-dependent DNA ligase [Proteobacteria bacterium]|nr:ATP-dependent DNA ligase [Pseudomonadota bacterium]